MLKEGERPRRTLYFSTDLVPARDRLPYLRDALGRSTARLDLGPIEGRPVGWSASVHAFDGLGVISGETSGVTVVNSVMLTGSGNIEMSPNANNFIKGAGGSSSLTNVNNTISGGGSIGLGLNALIFINNGTIETNNSLGAGTLQIAGSDNGVG